MKTNDIDFKKKTKRRYNLHFAIRKKGYRMNCTTRTIYIPYDKKASELHKNVRALVMEFDYSIQTEIT